MEAVVRGGGGGDSGGVGRGFDGSCSSFIVPAVQVLLGSNAAADALAPLMGSNSQHSRSGSGALIRCHCRCAAWCAIALPPKMQMVVEKAPNGKCMPHDLALLVVDRKRQ